MIATKRSHCILLSCLVLFASIGRCAQAQKETDTTVDLDSLILQAVKDAVKRNDASIVRIETTGGLERVGRVLKGTGPTTGLIVGADGWIISSAFNFIHKPAGILVTLGNGDRHAAEIVGTDHARMLTLLKIDASDLSVPAVASKTDLRVGQWVIAMGRTWSVETPSVSVGIISALQRIWGRAIQTDAKVSPVNYGGPLVDLSGRVAGVMVPLSPKPGNATAGVEWYDSGIGFAIPLEDVLQALPRLRKGDLRPGLMGVRFASTNLYEAAPKIAKVAWRSPAEKNGLQDGDQIITIDGAPIERLVDLRRTLGPKYAGDPVTVTVRRDSNEISATLELVGELPTFIQAYLGILPSPPRKEGGVEVRHSLPESPAAKAEIHDNDIIVAVGDTQVANRNDLERLMDERAPGDSLVLKIKRSDKIVDAKVTLGPVPDKIPTDVPARPVADAERSTPATGLIKSKVEASNVTYWVYVPENYQPAVEHAVVFWFVGREGPATDSLVKVWQDVCKERHVLLAGVAPARPAVWRTADFKHVLSALEHLTSSYAVDPSRIVAHGFGTGALAAEAFAHTHREKVRGLLLYGGGRLRAGATDPDEKLAYFVLWSRQDPRSSTYASMVERLRAAHFPAASRALIFAKRDQYLATGALREVGRWIEVLGSL